MNPLPLFAMLAVVLPLAWWFGGVRSPRRRRLLLIGASLATMACGLGSPDGSGGDDDAGDVIVPTPTWSAMLSIHPPSIAPAVGSRQTLTAVWRFPDGHWEAVTAGWTLLSATTAALDVATGKRVVVTGVVRGRTRVLAQHNGETAEAVVDVGGIDTLDPGPVFGCSEDGAIVRRYPAMGSPEAPTEVWRAPTAEWNRGMGFTMSRTRTDLVINAAAPDDAYRHDAGMIYILDWSSGQSRLYGNFGGNCPADYIDDSPEVILHYRGLDSINRQGTDFFVARGNDIHGYPYSFTQMWDDQGNGGSSGGGALGGPPFVPLYSDVAISDAMECYEVMQTFDAALPIVKAVGMTQGQAVPGFPPGSALPALLAEGASSGIAVDANGNVFVGGRSSGRVWRFHDDNGSATIDESETTLAGALFQGEAGGLLVNGIALTRDGGILVNVIQGDAAVLSGIYLMKDFDGDGYADPDLGEVIRYSPHPVMNTLDGGCIAAPR